MKEILFKNKSVLIDDEDYDLIIENSACLCVRDLYVQIKDPKTKKKTYFHRYITNCPKGMVVDHIDGNGLNNQKNNLRICTHSQNHANTDHSNGSSSYKGVHCNGDANKKNRRWVAAIECKGKRFTLGYFQEEYQAAMCYDIWAKDLFGEFANLNFKPAL